MLLAAGPLVFPFVRRLQGGGKRLIVVTAAVAWGVGVVFSVVLVAARPLIATVLGRPEAGLVEFGLQCLAMAFAGVTGIVVNASVARGVKRPWPPLALGIVTLLLCWPFRPNALDFAIVLLVSQGVTCLMSVAICLWGRQRELDTEHAADPLQQIENLAEAGDPLATAQAMYDLPHTESGGVRRRELNGDVGAEPLQQGESLGEAGEATRAMDGPADTESGGGAPLKKRILRRVRSAE